MNVPHRLREFLTDLRDEVCVRCRRLCGPRCEPCGTTLPLSQLIAALRQAQPGESAVAGYCPRTAEELAVLARDAAEDLEKRRRQRERLIDLWDCD